MEPISALHGGAEDFFLGGGGTAASWIQAAAAIAAIFASFALAEFQYRKERKRERDEAERKALEQVAQLYEFIWNTSAQVGALTSREDNPGALAWHWSNTTVHLEFAKMDAALTQMLAIPVTQLPRMEGGIRGVSDLIAAVITAKLVLGEHLNDEKTVELQELISTKLEPAQSFASSAGLTAFVEHHRLVAAARRRGTTKSWWQRWKPWRTKQKEEQADPDPPGVVINRMATRGDPNRRRFEIVARRMWKDITKMTCIDDNATAYVDPITRQMWDVWEASRRTTLHLCDVAFGSPLEESLEKFDEEVFGEEDSLDPEAPPNTA